MKLKHQSNQKRNFYSQALVSLILFSVLLQNRLPAEPTRAAAAANGTQSNGRTTAAVDETAARQVNATFSVDRVRIYDSAIFWFGRVNASENYADVRIGYTPSVLVVRLNIMDRSIWHTNTPTAGVLTEYDAVSLYLSLDGNSGTTPDTSDFRFVAMSSSEASNPAAQAAYQGNGAGWQTAVINFSATSGWRGTAPNDNVDDRGWSQEFSIPFSQLGLTGAPATGSVWGLAVVLHDRDSSGGPPLAVKTWPENLNTTQPGTWGRLGFGLPVYQPPNTPPRGTVTIRQGLNGAQVPDVAVGGTIGRLCPGDSNYIWNLWGNANFAGAPRFNLQNQGDIADWPCFSKYYLSFPLNQVPAGKVVLSARLTLHQWGGSNPDLALRSLIQIFSIREDWNEATLTWNNAPMAQENISQAWADVVRSCNWPCEPRTWDVSLAAARAIQAGEPLLKLGVYEADSAYHSGKYFISSEEPDWNELARPTLTITWGDPPATLTKSAWPAAPQNGETVTYTLRFTGSGEALSLNDALPGEVSAPFSLNASLGQLQYNSTSHRMSWSGSPPSGMEVLLSYTVTILTTDRRGVINTATLQGLNSQSTAQAGVAANGNMIFLPHIRK